MAASQDSSRLAETRVAEVQQPRVISGLHGSGDMVALATELNSLQHSLIYGADVSRYELRHQLGSGGQGMVLAVQDRDCGRTLAMKVLHERRGDQDGVTRFIHEAQIIAQLEHPGIVPLHDLNILPDGTLYYAMKRIDGHCLSEMMEHYSLPAQRFDSLEIFLKVCETMSFAHDRGVIHRDLKPSNIMVGPYGEVLVVDWGLAKILEGSQLVSPRDCNESGDAFATRCGTAVGTPLYMAPEQARGEGERIHKVSDIFSLGVILYELLSGVSPYQKQRNPMMIMQMCAQGRWTPISQCKQAQRVPACLAAIIEKAMAWDIADRYQRVSDLTADIRSYMAGEAVAAYQENLLEFLARCYRRYRTPVLTALVVCTLALLTAASTLLVSAHRQQQRINHLRYQAARAVARSDFTDAVAAYQHILALRADDPEAAQGVGRYGVLAERQVADASLQKLREDNRQRALEQAAAAAALMQQPQDLIRAREYLTQALALLPDSADREREQLLELRDQAQRLQLEAEQSQQREQASALLQEASLQAEQETWIEAQVALQQALQLIPSNPQSQELAERIRLGMQDAEQRRQAEAAQVLLQEASELRDQGNWDEAVARVQASIVLFASEESTSILADYLRERDHAHAEEQQHHMLQLVDSERAQIEAALATEDLALAQQHLLRIENILEDYPALARLRNIEELRQALADAHLSQRNRRAEQQLHQVLEHFRATQELEQAMEDIHQDLYASELRLEYYPADQELREHSHSLREQMRSLRSEQSRHLSQAVAALNQALAIAPDHPPVRDQVATFWAQRVVALERAGDAPAAAAAVAQGQHYDSQGRYQRIFQGISALRSLGAQPLQLFPLRSQANRRDEIAGPAILLHPDQEVEIPHGHWLISDGAGIWQARVFERGSAYVLNFPPPPGEIPEGMVYIPPTPVFSHHASMGIMHIPQSINNQTPAFLLARYELTCEEYLEFLNDPETLRQIDRRGRGGILRFAPRRSWDSQESLWHFEAGRFHLRYRENGEVIDPRLPVSNISREDVDAYLVWRRQRDQLPWRLPSGAEWQAAVQSGDGRSYPWGRLYDPAICYSYIAAPTQSGQVEQVVGSFPGDRSVHGVYDLAGSLAEFVDETWFDDPGISVARGGSFADREAQRFTVHARRAVDNRLPLPAVGFRLALDADL